jgi:hypothetical protein
MSNNNNKSNANTNIYNYNIQQLFITASLPNFTDRQINADKESLNSKELKIINDSSNEIFVQNKLAEEGLLKAKINRPGRLDHRRMEKESTDIHAESFNTEQLNVYVSADGKNNKILMNGLRNIISEKILNQDFVSINSSRRFINTKNTSILGSGK